MVDESAWLARQRFQALLHGIVGRSRSCHHIGNSCRKIGLHRLDVRPRVYNADMRNCKAQEKRPGQFLDQDAKFRSIHQIYWKM